MACVFRLCRPLKGSDTEMDIMYDDSLSMLPRTTLMTIVETQGEELERGSSKKIKLMKTRRAGSPSHPDHQKEEEFKKKQEEFAHNIQAQMTRGLFQGACR